MKGQGPFLVSSKRKRTPPPYPHYYGESIVHLNLLLYQPDSPSDSDSDMSDVDTVVLSEKKEKTIAKPRSFKKIRSLERREEQTAYGYGTKEEITHPPASS